MGLTEIFLIGIGLAMDAFAVAVCKGLSMQKMNWKKAIIISTYFAAFQMGMPIIGYFLGVKFQYAVNSIGHWIASILLVIIGSNMIKESLNKNYDKNDNNDKVDFKTMSVLAIATSIDALAIGITFAFLKINIIFAINIIGSITFILSLIGVKIGHIFGDMYKNKAQCFGGMVLIFLGIKILIEHLLNFTRF